MEVMSQPEQQQLKFESNFTVYVLQKISNNDWNIFWLFEARVKTLDLVITVTDDPLVIIILKDMKKKHAWPIPDGKTAGFVLQSTRDSWAEESALLQLSADHQRHGEWKWLHILLIPPKEMMKTVWSQFKWQQAVISYSS